MNPVKNNIQKMYLLRFFTSCWMIAPVLIPYYESAGLTATGVFTVQSAFFLAMFFLEVPSGYIADLFGRRFSIILGSAAFPAGLLVYAFSGSIWGFLLAEAFIAFAIAMRSGSDQAMMYDTLKNIKKEKDYKKTEGKAAMLERIGDSIASPLGGFIGAVNLKLVFFINAAVMAVMTPVALTLKEPVRKKIKTSNHAAEIAGILKFCAARPKVLLPILMYSVVFGSSIIAIWAYYMYYRELGIGVAWYGLLHAGLSLASGAASFYAHKIEKKIGLKMAILALMPFAVFCVLLGIFKSHIMITLIFVNGFILGLSVPVLFDAINKQVPSKIRATVISVANMGRGIFFIIFSHVFGFITDKSSLGNAFIFLGIFYALAGFLIFTMMVRKRVV